ncbi:hypothetical protein [Agromyces sp. H66]|uniref:hypothetical protein n=1 Tax=Agromyces sp. H66 TaxID=2529859 RepID=UPI0010A9C2F4|nr:hypothetical protein [Agromyces sp. H66]
MQRRRTRLPNQQPALGPEDDPYLAYLIWREERDAAERAAQATGDAEVIAEPTRRSWTRRLAVWRRADPDHPDH